MKSSIWVSLRIFMTLSVISYMTVPYQIQVISTSQQKLCEEPFKLFPHGYPTGWSTMTGPSVQWQSNSNLYICSDNPIRVEPQPSYISDDPVRIHNSSMPQRMQSFEAILPYDPIVTFETYNDWSFQRSTSLFYQPESIRSIHQASCKAASLLVWWPVYSWHKLSETFYCLCAWMLL
jgi:hypothetical protein